MDFASLRGELNRVVDQVDQRLLDRRGVDLGARALGESALDAVFTVTALETMVLTKIIT